MLKLVICLTGICIAAGAGHAVANFGHEALDVSVNGASCFPEASYYPIYPARANHLRLRVDFNALNRDALTATLVRTLPDGRLYQETANLAPELPEAVFDLGTFAVPAQYDYENGVVYRRGCRFTLTVIDEPTGQAIAVFGFYQGPARAPDCEALWTGDVKRYVYNSGYDAGRGWRPNDESGAPMDPPFLLKLDPAVLSDPDDVRVMFRQKEGLNLPPVIAELLISRLPDGKKIHRRRVLIGPQWKTEKVGVSRYADGNYRIELRPEIEGTKDHEGPYVIYHRRTRAPSAVRVSYLAPWTLVRDSARGELTISDFRQAVEKWAAEQPDPAKWQVDGRLLGQGDARAKPVVLRVGLRGYYAVFARAVKRCYVQAGKDRTVREVGNYGDTFLTAVDMTDGEVAVFQSGTKGEGLASLRFIPVTPESVEKFQTETSNPQTRLVGVADWCDYFVQGSRLDADQWDALIRGHVELGMRDLEWSIGRSWVEYESRLPDTTRFPCIPLAQADPKIQAIYSSRAYMVNKFCPLTEALQRRGEYHIRLWPWLAMQRHYGGAYGGIFASEWFKAHPEWHRWQKHGTGPEGSVVCYFFPEVRKERVDIFCEVARKHPDGLVIGCCRQVPMLLYHPDMVAAYKQKTGVDPRTLDASDGKAYMDWIRWRADFFTQTLRELKERLAPIRAETGLPIPVAARVPSAGFIYNIAQGTDVETWCREGLIDILQVEPLEDRGGRGSHDMRPYIDLGRRYGIPVLGGINGITLWKNYTVILKRALGLLEAGVDGIEIYESNAFCVMSPQRWLIPLLGNKDRLREFLSASNIEACYPVWATNACAGFDNHSFGPGWNVYEGAGTPL